MNLITAVLIVAASTHSSEPTDYKTAYNRALDDNKPLLVLVTAEWCPPCHRMKTKTIPDMISANKFQDVHFATLDFDEDAKTAQQMIGDRGIPQLILYERDGERWSVKYLTGFQSVSSVESFISGKPLLHTAQAGALAIDQ